jgi:hypothetical protein
LLSDQNTDECLSVNDLLAIFNIQSLVRLAVQHTALHIKVAAGAVGIDGADGWLDAGSELFCTSQTYAARSTCN